MRKPSWVVLGSFAIALAGSGSWLSVSGVRPMKVAVSFVGFTTNTSTPFTSRQGIHPATLSIFRVSNLGSRKVVLLGIYAYEPKQDPVGADVNIWAPEICTLLNPGEIKAVSVVTPRMIDTPWRAVFHYSAYCWRQRFQALPPWEQIIMRPLVTDRLVANFPTETVTSDWVASTGGQ